MSKPPAPVLGIDDYKRFMKAELEAKRRVFYYKAMTAEDIKASQKRARLRMIRRIAREIRMAREMRESKP